MTAISDLDIFARVARTGSFGGRTRDGPLPGRRVESASACWRSGLEPGCSSAPRGKLTLTETGEAYFKRVIDILSLVEEAEDFVSRRNTRPAAS